VLAVFLISSACNKKDELPIVTGEPEITQYGSPFPGVPDTRDLSFYEVNMRAFSSAGTFKGVQDRLDSIKALGVNTLWLMPIHPVGVLNSVGQLGSPYSVMDYKKVNSEFGTLEDLRSLVSQAHSRNMSVIIDWVANHTSWDNPWIQNKSWYSQDATGNIIKPAGTNWADVADLNYNNAEMRLNMISAMKYWILVANIDGYRCDAADLVPADFWKQATDSLKKIPNRKLTLLAEGARSDHFGAGFQLNYAWDFFTAEKNVFKNNAAASTLITANSNENLSVVSGGQKLRFTTNHDETAWNMTPLALFGGLDGSMAAFVISSYLGGTPLIYTGQEVGCSVNTPFFSRQPIDWTANASLLTKYKQVMGFRAINPAARYGALETFSDPNIVAFRKTVGAEQVLVLVNVRNAASTMVVPAALANTSWFNSFDNAVVSVGTSVNLAAYGYLILRRS
jgi:glycosidase